MSPTRATNDAVERTAPLIRRNVSREVAATVEPRIASVATALHQDISTLRTTVQETSSTTADANREALGTITRRLDEIERQLEQLNARA